MGLPLRYRKSYYTWCLDWKIMGPRCGSRDWTREEMTAYLDWDTAENARIQAQVEAEVDPSVDTGRRGVTEIWRRIERDAEEQEALYNSIS